MARSTGKNGGTTGGSVGKGGGISNVAKVTPTRTGRSNPPSKVVFSPVRNLGGRGSK